MLKTVTKIRENGLKTAVLTNSFYFDNKKDDSTIFIDRTLFDEVSTVFLVRP